MSRWKWVVDWQDFLPSSTLVALLQKHFFPKWLQVLDEWLDRFPDYNEIGRWFQGWKEEFGQVKDILAHAQVKFFINQALEMMNRAASGAGPMAMQAGAYENMRYLASREGIPNLKAMPPPPPPPAPQMSGSVSMAPQVPETFRELVANKCGERGILFMPVPGRNHEGKQIYRCGNSMVYIDRTNIFVQRSSMWIHTSLDNLLSNAL